MKKEWGKRYNCHNCNSAFFDLCRSQVICPCCETKYINMISSTKQSIILNNQFPDSLEDVERIKYSSINIIAKELAQSESQKFLGYASSENNTESLPEELLIHRSDSTIAS